jgi:hypothetical protein
LTKIDTPLLYTKQEIIVPNHESIINEWEENYFTHFYNGIHQSVNDVKLEIEEIEEQQFRIKFIGQLYESDKYKIEGTCLLKITNELKGFWIYTV